MFTEDRIITKEDYEEPACPLCAPDAPQRIPLSRVITKLTGYLKDREYGAAERHLNYWLEEAENCGDIGGALAVLGEITGLCRRTGKREEGLAAADEALRLVEAADMSGTAAGATAMLNCGTAYKAFGRSAEAVVLYEKVRAVYEKLLPAGDEGLAGLYNNMALALVDEKDYDRAEELYGLALDIMSSADGGALYAAVTYCNLADLYASKLGLEGGCKIIDECLGKARAALDDTRLKRDAEYAFNCEKCAAAFGYYGYFMDEAELKQRAEKCGE